MVVQRTETHEIKPSHPQFGVLLGLCDASARLYNRVLFIYRNALVGSHENVPEYKDVIVEDMFVNHNKLLKRMRELNEPTFRALKSQTASHVLIQVQKIFQSYYKAMKAWGRKKSDFKGKPQLPDYKEGKNIVVYDYRCSSLKRGRVNLGKGFTLDKIKTNLTNFQQIRLVPSPCGLKVEIVYNVETQEVPSLTEINPTNSAGVDLGIRNLATIASDSDSSVFNGRGLLSINQFYHKKSSELRSVYEKNGIETGSKMNRLDRKHQNKVRDYLHKTSRNVVNWAVEHSVDCLFIGRNVDWKQNVNIGKRNNQNFCSIPHWKLIQMITYKAAEVGIRVELVQESHTSKCSFLDNESIGHHDEYVGKRVKRGLFRASDGRTINADVNGALNIMKRGLDLEDSFKVSSGVFHTIKINATRKCKRAGRGIMARTKETRRRHHLQPPLKCNPKVA